MNPSAEKHLDKTTFFLMLGTAILIDCITWIPPLGTIINIVATLGFGFGSKLMASNLTKTGRPPLPLVLSLKSFLFTNTASMDRNNHRDVFPIKATTDSSRCIGW